MHDKIYQSLPQDEEFDGSGIAKAEETLRSKFPPTVSVRRNITIGIFCITLLVSLAANAWFLHQHYVVPWELADRLPSKFAQLKRNFPVEIVAHSDFDSVNRTTQDRAWDDPDLEPWRLFLALDDNYATSKGLPHSQRWPWDPHKGAYIPIGAHELHCVRVLRTVVNENHDGLLQVDQTWPYAHVLHCLNILRDSVMCHADDTPMYTGRLHKNALIDSPKAGVGTFKKCRDWNMLVTWARARSACYRPIHQFDREEFDELERYKFCPDGTRPWESA